MFESINVASSCDLRVRHAVNQAGDGVKLPKLAADAVFAHKPVVDKVIFTDGVAERDVVVLEGEAEELTRSSLRGVEVHGLAVGLERLARADDEAVGCCSGRQGLELQGEARAS